LSKNSGFLPKVSVIVPVKNGAATIRDLLDSLMQLEYDKGKLEIVVVDGNSVDKTCEIVSRYPVRLLTEERPGLNAARNTGIKNSTGEIIVFTDSDCVVPRNWIERIIENFQDTEVGCVGGSTKGYYSDFLSRYSDESIIPVLRRFSKREVLSAIKPPLKYPAGCNMAIRREVTEKAGFFNENIVYGFDEDEFVERICKNGNKMVLDPEVMVMHKHRSTILNLLKQNFRYGQGIGSFPRTVGIKSEISRWGLACIVGFLTWISIISSLAVHAVFTLSLISLTALLAVILLPPIALILIYTYYNARNNRGKIAEIMKYPFIDIARSMAFLVGGLYQLLKPKARKR